MKKFFIYILTAVIAVTSFSFPAFADSEPSYDVDALYAEAMDKYHEFMQDTDDSSVKEINDMLRLPYHCFIVYQERSYKYLTIISSIYKDISYSSDEAVVRGTELFYTYFEWDDNSSFGCRYSVTNKGSSIPSNSTGNHMPVEAFLKNSNFNLTYDNVEYAPFDLNNPPDVFRYTIDKPNFTLKNDDFINVHIEYTGEYLDWVSKARSLSLDGNFSYSFIIYVSSIKPTNTETLARSLNNVNYVRLKYDEYLYEGGQGYAKLVPDPTYQEGEKPTSHSGKSPHTIGAGVNIAHFIDIDKNPSIDIPIKTENIYGYDDHTPIYVCVFAAHAESGIAEPNLFNNSVLDYQLYGHDTPNDTYSQYFDVLPGSGGGGHFDDDEDSHSGGGGHFDDDSTDVEESPDDNPPDYSMHTYFFPFDCVDNCKGDGYNGNYKYKPQNLHGKDYKTTGRVTDLTNKEIPPELLHDEDMKDGEWVKPEDYSKWQFDHYNENKYDENYKFDAGTLKDIFSNEGDFFTFLKSAFAIFPAWVTVIFVSFICCVLVIALMKFIL